jgi:dynein heavy chain
VVQVFQQRDGERNDLSKRTPTEFLSLSEWMSQSTMFNVLTSMKFFKHYLIGKVFRLWKGNCRFRTYNRTRANLSKQLIQLRPDFCPKFMEINKILFEM